MSGLTTGAAAGSVAGPMGTVVGGGLGLLKDAFGSGRDGGANYVPQHGGFTGPGYGQPGAPGFDANGLALGQGQNGYDANGRPLPPPVDPVAQARANAFNWRGDPNGAAGDVQRYQGLAQGWGDLRSPGNDYGQANGYAGLGDQARQGQGDALGLMRDAAMGNAPSRAQIMMQQGAANAAATQGQLAASARGPAAMALAQQQAAANTSMGNAQNIGNMGALRADEMAQARNAYMGGATGMRGQDLGFYGQASNNAQANGQLGLGYRQLGQQGQLGFEGMGYNVNSAQYGGRMAQYGAQDAAFQHQQSINQQSRANDISTINAGATVIGAVGSLIPKPGGGGGK